jgi:DNA ligase-associated metallophosphoesterase
VTATDAARVNTAHDAPVSTRVDHVVTVMGMGLVADHAGALFWPDEGLLVVSDLHFEKGSSFARRGILLPPYDTAATLAKLALLIARYAPRTVISLGDNFHDGDGANRLADTDRAALRGLQRGRDWLWITGNHDPEPAEGIGGRFAATVVIGPLVFRHEPSPVVSYEASPGHADGEISGHLHPMAWVSRRGRAVSRRCFVCDGRRAVMPAFGAYTGGLNIRHPAFAPLFAPGIFTAHLLGHERLYAIAAKHCLGD